MLGMEKAFKAFGVDELCVDKVKMVGEELC